MTVQPLQLAFYKGMGGKHGAVQFQLQKPHYYVSREVIREEGLQGCEKFKNFQGKFIPDEWLRTEPLLKPEHLVTREGAIFLEITSTIGKNKYDWDNKITFALSLNDMGKLLMVLEGQEQSASLTHDPFAKSARAGQITKNLQLYSPDGVKRGALLTVSLKDGENDRKHTVPLSGDEVKILAACFRAVIPVSLSWI